MFGMLSFICLLTLLFLLRVRLLRNFVVGRITVLPYAFDQLLCNVLVGEGTAVWLKRAGSKNPFKKIKK